MYRIGKNSGMKLLGSNDENAESGNNRAPQIRTSQDDAASYGFHPPQENEFPAFVPSKRWVGGSDDIEVMQISALQSPSKSFFISSFTFSVYNTFKIIVFFFYF